MYILRLDKKDGALTSRLLKIAGSSDAGGTFGNNHALSRTAKLVLAASNSTPKHSVSKLKEKLEKKSLYSNHVAQKKAPKV